MSREVIVKGIKFKSIKDACNHFGTDYKLAMSRINGGKPLEWSILTNEDLRDGNGKSVVFRGVRYNSVMELAQHYGVSYQNLKNKTNKGGMSLEEAMEYLISRGFIFRGRRFYSISELSRYYGVSYSSLRRRLNKGMSLEEALRDLLRRF